jgi:DNA-directed RNA polymerase subunit RPC12/RpoP
LVTTGAKFPFDRFNGLEYILFTTFEYPKIMNMDEPELNPERERGWCSECGRANYPHESSAPEEMICPGCGSEMKPLNRLTKTQRAALDMQDWCDEVASAGKWGPSPGGAAGELRCDRSMIDKLAERGILEKSIYEGGGQYVVIISARSIKKAKENKEKRGKWTDTGED